MTTLTQQPPESPIPHRFTREEYYRMADAELFNGKRVELIEGEIFEMSPQKNSHYLAISRTSKALEAVFGDQFWIRTQAPLHLGETSEPEPDLAVVPGPMTSYKDHPTTALLVIEVSDTTLRFDRNEKASLYARAGIQDYWIINLKENTVEVFRDPAPNASAMYGFKYRPPTTFTATQSLSPLAKPEAIIPVANLLP